MEEKLQKENLNHKSWLLLLKYIPHLLGALFFIYNITYFLNIDLVVIGYIVMFLLLIFVYITSKIFKFCYVHRLPLYYLALGDLTSIVDYYFPIPISDITLLIIHLSLIGLLIFGYTQYYLKRYGNSRKYQCVK